MHKKTTFVFFLVALILGASLGGVLALASSDVPQGTAIALAKEKFTGASVVESYVLSDSKVVPSKIFLICGSSDNFLHKVKISGTASKPLVIDLGRVNGVSCGK